MMEPEKFVRYKCSKCQRVEDVLEGETAKVNWREVILDAGGSGRCFRFCPDCVAATFGKEHVDNKETASNARHLRTIEAITEDVEGLSKQVEKLTREPMEKNFSGTDVLTRDKEFVDAMKRSECR